MLVALVALQHQILYIVINLLLGGPSNLSGCSNAYCNGAGIAARSGTVVNCCATFQTWVLFGVGWYTTSDKRIKTNIKTITSTKLSELNVVSYNYIDKTKDQRRQFGLLAQELKDIYPELINEKEDYLPNVYQKVKVISNFSFECEKKLSIGSELLMYDLINDRITCKVIERNGNIYTTDNINPFDETLFVYGSKEDIKNVNYTALIPLLLVEHQNQLKINKELPDKLDKLENILEKLMKCD